jgi:O-6-methylguanine DNA methyltransferase
MIDIYVKKTDITWFGLTYVDERVLATVVSPTKENAVRSLLRSVPFGAKHQIIEQGSEFAEKMILMLRELDSGNEKSKDFSLAAEYISEPVGRVLKAAAAIPIGYVTSYGNIAKTTDTEPRTVGRIMATNPLYPIVPCHRVVGADFSLVGYGGRKSLSALQAKLARLRKEAKGFNTEKEVLTNGKKLTVYPVEYVINKAEKRSLGLSRQQRLFDCAPARGIRAQFFLYRNSDCYRRIFSSRLIISPFSKPILLKNLSRFQSFHLTIV